VGKKKLKQIAYNDPQLGEPKHSTYFRQIAVMYQYGEFNEK
jgi:hypothetical protein